MTPRSCITATLTLFALLFRQLIEVGGGVGEFILQLSDALLLGVSITFRVAQLLLRCGEVIERFLMDFFLDATSRCHDRGNEDGEHESS